MFFNGGALASARSDTPVLQRHDAVFVSNAKKVELTLSIVWALGSSTRRGKASHRRTLSRDPCGSRDGSGSARM